MAGRYRILVRVVVVVLAVVWLLLLRPLSFGDLVLVIVVACSSRGAGLLQRRPEATAETTAVIDSRACHGGNRATAAVDDQDPHPSEKTCAALACGGVVLSTAGAVESTAGAAPAVRQAVCTRARRRSFRTSWSPSTLQVSGGDESDAWSSGHTTKMVIMG